jgi:hypothetical protein
LRDAEAAPEKGMAPRVTGLRPPPSITEEARGCGAATLVSVDDLASATIPGDLFSEFLDEIPSGAPLTCVVVMLVIPNAGGGLSMSRGVLEVHDSRVRPGGFDPDEFARSVRRLALDAHHVLSRPDSRLGELIRLHGRVFHLLQGAPGTRTTGILPWLLAVRELVGTRLQRWSVEDLESRLA